MIQNVQSFTIYNIHVVSGHESYLKYLAQPVRIHSAG